MALFFITLAIFMALFITYFFGFYRGHKHTMYYLNKLMEKDCEELKRMFQEMNKKNADL